MIDWNQVDELRQMIGAEEFEQLLDMFVDEIEQALASLGDPATAQPLDAQLHFLKGSARNLGFAAFASLCETGEQAARAGRTADVNIDDITRLWAESKATFLDELPRRFVA